MNPDTNIIGIIIIGIILIATLGLLKALAENKPKAFPVRD